MFVVYIHVFWLAVFFFSKSVGTLLCLLPRYRHQLLCSGTAWAQYVNYIWARVSCCTYTIQTKRSPLLKTLLHCTIISQSSFNIHKKVNGNIILTFTETSWKQFASVILNKGVTHHEKASRSIYIHHYFSLCNTHLKSRFGRLSIVI